MDLGFGSKNQEFGQAAASVLLRGAEAQEQTIDAELAQYDRALRSGVDVNIDDDEGLQSIRERRLRQLQQQHDQNKKWKELGHGTYTELGSGGSGGTSTDIAKEFFKTTKESDRVVIHFYRPSTRSCDAFHALLSKLAPKHVETKFIKINVEGADHENGTSASFLVEKLGVIIMPTLVLVKDRKVVHHLRGFDELGGTEDVSPQMLAHVLGLYGVTDLQDDEEVPEEILKAKGINSIRINKKGAKKSIYDDDEF
jgi:thiol-disulfide isomerase/thioredoxin